MGPRPPLFICFIELSFVVYCTQFIFEFRNSSVNFAGVFTLRESIGFISRQSRCFQKLRIKMKLKLSKICMKVATPQMIMTHSQLMAQLSLLLLVKIVKMTFHQLIFLVITVMFMMIIHIFVNHLTL